MKGTRWLIATTTVLATGAGLLLGGVFDGGRAPAPAAVADIVGPRLAAAPAVAGSTSAAAQIGLLQARLREQPEDVESLALLGLAYQQRARETGDPGFLAKAEGVLEQAIERAPADVDATSGLGQLALARHDFVAALELGERARELAPDSDRPYAIVGDALLELGRYEEAFEAFDRMAALKPSAASYARVSYARELLGDLPGAIAAMELALDAATGSAEPYAWTAVQLGRLHFQVGGLAEAEAAYRDALAAVPAYAFALEALAELTAAHGDLPGAIELAEQAVAGVPLPQFVTLLAELKRAAGDTAGAEEQFALLDTIDQLQNANGVRTDLETALSYADRGVRLAEALELARRGQAVRPSVLGDDTLAWVLERNGRCQEARDASERALRLGTRDALVFFHRGMIERCLGDEAGAREWFGRALEANPHFSLRWVPVAREALGGEASA